MIEDASTNYTDADVSIQPLKESPLEDPYDSASPILKPFIYFGQKF